MTGEIVVVVSVAVLLLSIMVRSKARSLEVIDMAKVTGVIAVLVITIAGTMLLLRAVQ